MGGAPSTPSRLSARLRYLSLFSLLLLIVVAPFERVKPAVTLIQMALPHVEIVLVVTLLVCLCSCLALDLFLGVAAAFLAIWVHGVFDYFLVFTPTYILIWATWGTTEAHTSTVGEHHANSL